MTTAAVLLIIVGALLLAAVLLGILVWALIVFGRGMTGREARARQRGEDGR